MRQTGKFPEVEQRASHQGNRQPLPAVLACGGGSSPPGRFSSHARTPREGRGLEPEAPSSGARPEDTAEARWIHRPPRAVSLPPASGLGSGAVSHLPMERDGGPCARASSLPPGHGVQLPHIDISSGLGGSTPSTHAVGMAARGSPTDSKDHGRFPAIGESSPAACQLSARQAPVGRRSGNEPGQLRLPRVDDRAEERKVSESQSMKRWAGGVKDSVDLW
mmetsp:Transcript_11350/g.20753  ORF Transcript_11350/g.20753 Transcript_11350/m.20753 type:complete len:220 (-) Transcript_11350:89-748(-)